MGKLGIIAGGGPIPRLLAEQCLADGRPFFILGITGGAEAEVTRFPHAWVGIGEVGKLFRTLCEQGCEEVVFIGAVRRPDVRHLKLDWGGVRFLPRYIRAAMGGDDQLLRVLVNEIERRGYRVIGVQDVLTDAAAPSGVLGKIIPSADNNTDIERGVPVVRQMGALDIGQSAVVCAGIVLAVEAAEGTDAMLIRCAALPPAIRGSAAARRGVLVKLPKPAQEKRIDMPAIGVTTVRNAATAGLAGIAYAAGGALLVDVPGMIREADAAGLFLLGLPDSERAP